MIDIKLIKNTENIKYILKKRNFNINLNFLFKKDKERIEIKYELEKLQKFINEESKKIGINKNQKNNFNIDIEYLKNIKNKIFLNKKKLKKIEKIILNYCLKIPNIPDKSLFKNNNSIYYYNKKKVFNYNIKSYIYIGEKMNYLNFNDSSKISGSKFVIFKNKIALVHRALIQFMLDVHINKNKYEEIYIPLIVNKDSMYGTGQLPKFYKDIFYVNTYKNKNPNLCLIPTSEVPLINIFKNKILLEKQLPIKYVSYSSCFRYESNSYGINFKGLIRLNQFDKVELIQVVNPDKSNDSLEEITNHAEMILKLLKLHYRKRLLKIKELSFSSCKTYDLEVWFPYQKKYIEVSSCSNTSNFQSKRILAKYRNFSNFKKKDFIHILNASGLAVGRTLAAIIENYQINNNDFEIPKVLTPYIKSYI